MDKNTQAKTKYTKGERLSILLPKPDSPSVYHWVEGEVISEHGGGGFGALGVCGVYAQGQNWRGCNPICLLPADATEEQKTARLNEVLAMMEQGPQEST